MEKRQMKALILSLILLVSALVAGCGNNWPSHWSKDLPEFKYGHVSGIRQDSMDKALGWESVTVSDFEPNALAKYKADVKAAGWTMISDENVYFSGVKNKHMVSVLIGSLDGTNVAIISYRE